jgi:hypothetical protein
LLTSVERALAPNAEGIIERCGRGAAEEGPDFVAGIVRELVKPGQRTK